MTRALEAQNWKVFWDRTIPAGKTWREVIGQQLKAAECLVVLWSKSSITSDWVMEEAEIGRRRGILVPVLIEDVEPPLGFQSLQAADLSKWDGTEADSLVSDITAILGAATGEEATRLRAEELGRERAVAERQRICK